MTGSDTASRLNASLGERYWIERRLGEGGMATVYLARDLRHGRNVALKVLRPELAAVVGADRFLAEIQTTASLQHPHILPLFDSGEADGFLFYVMPHVEGESLRARLDGERQLPVEEALRIATEVAEALEYAHRHGVIHRDIKPANIMLQAGKAVVSDFGIALALGVAGGGRLTETGMSLGTPHYMSPEQAAGDQDVDPRSDVYALGCVLYEMLTGDPPHRGSTAQVVLAKILTDPTPAPTRIRPSTPPNVDAAVRKAMERLPADRFESARAFAAALTNAAFRHGERVSALPGATARSRLLVGAVVALAIVTAFLAGALLGPGPVASRPARFTLALPRDLTPVDDPSAVNLAVSPDGYTVVFAARSADGRSQLWQRSLNELDPTPIPGTENAQNPRFSPDGRSIAYTANPEVRVVSLTGAPPRTVLSVANPTFRGLAWGSDGLIYIGQFDRGIARVPEEGGAPEQVVVAGANEFLRWPDALPDGKGILFTRWVNARAEIVLASPTESAPRALLGGEMARYARSGHIIYVARSGELLAVPFDLGSLELTGSPTPLLEGVTVQPSSAAEFALAATGSLVYKRGTPTRGGTPVWVTADGLVEPLEPIPAGSFRRPAFSPDGSRIAFEYAPPGSGGAPPANDDWGIWIYDLTQSGAFYRLSLQDPSFDPFWSPDGREVGFSSASLGPPTLYARPRDGSAPARQLRASPGMPLLEGRWTPDGRGLVYRRGSDNEGTDVLYAPPYPDSASTSIADSRFDELLPALSPDGRWLAYQSNESGRDEIYVTPFPGPGGRAPVSVDGGQYPIWSHSGTEIFYLGPDGAWTVAQVQAGADLVVQSRRRWAPAAGFPAERGFALSPDGRRILAIRPDPSDARVDIVVVQGFLDELVRLAGE